MIKAGEIYIVCLGMRLWHTGFYTGFLAGRGGGGRLWDSKSDIMQGMSVPRSGIFKENRISRTIW